MAQVSTVQSVRESIEKIIGPEALLAMESSGRLLVTRSDSLGVDQIPRVGRNSMASVSRMVNDKGFALHLARIRQAQDRAVETIGKVDDCAIVKSTSRDAWQMILQDASVSGKWRIQCFDARGFSGHMVFNDKQEAIEYAASHDYTLRDDGALDRVFNTPAFQRGLFAADLIRRINLGQLTFEQSNVELAQYDEAQATLSSVAAMGAQAFVGGDNRVMVLLADRIQKGQESAVFLHEVSHIWGRSAMNPDVWTHLIDRLKDWSRRPQKSLERRIHDAAKTRVTIALVSPRLADEEFFAYAVEEAVKLGVQPSAAALEGSAQAWLAQVVDTLERTLLAATDASGVARLAVDTFPQDLQQLVDLAYAMAQLESPARSRQIWERLSASQRDRLNEILTSKGRDRISSALDGYSAGGYLSQLKAAIQSADGDLDGATASHWREWLIAHGWRGGLSGGDASILGVNAWLSALGNTRLSAQDVWSFVDTGLAWRSLGPSVDEQDSSESVRVQLRLNAHIPGIPDEIATLNASRLVLSDGSRVLRIHGAELLDSEERLMAARQRLAEFEAKSKKEYAAFLHESSWRGSDDKDASLRLSIRLAAMTPMMDVAAHQQSQSHYMSLLLAVENAVALNDSLSAGQGWAGVVAHRVLVEAALRGFDVVEFDDGPLHDACVAMDGVDVSSDKSILMTPSLCESMLSGLPRFDFGLSPDWASDVLLPPGPPADARLDAFLDYWRNHEDGPLPTYEQAARFVGNVMREYARSKGVIAEFSAWAPYGQATGIELTDLVVLDSNDGASSEVIAELSRLADQVGLAIYLRPSGPRTREFYEGFGFERSVGHFGFLVRYPDVTGDDDPSDDPGRGTFNRAATTDSHEPAFSFAGESAQDAPMASLHMAKARMSRGEDAGLVRQQTGWFRGPDGRWRFEIDDSSASLKPMGEAVFAALMRDGRAQVALGDLLDHPRLLAAYPWLSGLRVELEPGRSGGIFKSLDGEGGDGSWSILLGVNGATVSLSVLLHEVQHAIQRAEGFATGGTPSDLAWANANMRAHLIAQTHALVQELQPPSFELYWGEERTPEGERAYAEFLKEWRSPQYQRQLGFASQRGAAARVYDRLAGEVEARDVQARMAMSEAQRRDQSPALLDPDRELVVLVNGQEMHQTSAGPRAAAPQSLHQVREIWRVLGVEHELTEKEGRIQLGQIIVPKERRGQGVGSQAIAALMAYADASGQRVELSPSTDFGASSKARLQRFFRRFGFVANQGVSRYFTAAEMMLRHPRDSGFIDLQPNASGQELRTYKVGDTTLVLSVSPFEPGVVHLSSLRTPMTKRRKGSARAAMKVLLAQADRQGVSVNLIASALDDKTSQTRLGLFYRSLGFELTGRRANAWGHPEMLRVPRVAAAADQTMPEMVEVDGVMRPTRNSRGMFIHPNIAAVQRFWRWYAPAAAGHASALLDADGRPAVLYHGTNEDVDALDAARERMRAGETVRVVYATNDAQVASEFALYRSVWPGANVMPVYVRARALLVIEGHGRAIREVEAEIDTARLQAWSMSRRGDLSRMEEVWAGLEAATGVNLRGMEPRPDETLRSFAKRNGFDGIVFRDVRDDVGPDVPRASDVHVFLEPVSIKSATGNLGDFDPLQDSVRMSVGSLMAASATAGEGAPGASAEAAIEAMLFVRPNLGFLPKAAGSMQWLARGSNEVGPVYRGHGIEIHAVAQIDQDDFDAEAGFARFGLMGHAARCVPASKTFAFKVVEAGSLKVIGSLVSDVDESGDIVSVHDVAVIAPGNGHGRRLLSHLVANAPSNTIKIQEITSESEEFWRRLNVGYIDAYRDAHLEGRFAPGSGPERKSDPGAGAIDRDSAVQGAQLGDPATSQTRAMGNQAGSGSGGPTSPIGFGGAHEAPQEHAGVALDGMVVREVSDEGMQAFVDELGLEFAKVGRRWVKDARGADLEVYHGTSASFPDFISNPRGIFFAEDPAKAATFKAIRKGGQPRVIKARLNVNKVWKVIRYGDDVPYSQMIDQSVDALRKQGFDAMHCSDDGVWIVFDPKQVDILCHDIDQELDETDDVAARLAAEMDDVRQLYGKARDWLKAPNGESTKLSKRQWLLVRTDSFKAWFGDWQKDPQNASKALDENGEPKIYFHGSKEAGFTQFDTDGRRKTDGAGAFFASTSQMARGYSGGSKKTPVYLPEQIFKEPDLIDGLEIEKGILVSVVVSSQGRKAWSWFESEQHAREELELAVDDPLESKEGYRVLMDGYEELVGDKPAVLDHLADMRVKEPGMYEVFLNIRDMVDVDWEGKNWDQGPQEDVWDIEDENGNQIDWAYSEEERDALLASNPGSTAEHRTQSVYDSSDDAARQARQMGAGGILLRDICDTGPDGYADHGDICVVFEPENIKWADNIGTFDPGTSDIRFSIPVKEDVGLPAKGNRKALNLTLRPGHKGYFDAYVGKRRVGAICAWEDSRGEFVVMEVVVSPPYRRRGVATALYRAVEEQAGRQLKPAVSLSDDGFEFWKAYRPEAVADDLRHRLDELIGRKGVKNGREGIITKASGGAATLTHPDGMHTTVLRRELDDVLFPLEPDDGPGDGPGGPPAGTSGDEADAEGQGAAVEAEDESADTLTGAPAFQSWFSGSKVVDADGRPLVVYHGTAADFEYFDNAKTGANDGGMWGRGHYFAANPETANSYAMRQGDEAHVIPAYVAIKNPLILKTGGDLVTRLPDGTNTKDLVGPNLDGKKIKDIAVSGGHDGVIQIRPNGMIGDVVAYDAKQIKSAIGNNGDYDTQNPDIRFSKPVVDAVASQSVPVASMPQDMQDILMSFFEEFGAELPANLPVTEMDLSLFPEVGLADGVTDVRGLDYAKEMIGKDVPPIIVHGDTWLDGRHRVWAAKQSGAATIRAIDLAGLVPEVCLDVIEPIGKLKDVAFAAWFGNSAVANADGSPRVVYHGTVVRPDTDKVKGMGDIYAFDRMFTTQFRAPSLDTVGSWFSTNPGKGGAEMYSGNHAGSVIYPVYLSIQNPQVTTFQLLQRRARLLANGKDDGRQIGAQEVEAYRQWLKATGKDGIKIEGSGNEGSTEFDQQEAWIALEPEQIKSAIGNNGDFDAENPDIRFSKPAAASEPTFTAGFQQWFSGSTVVDEDGQPLVVYHGTQASFTQFSEDFQGSTVYSEDVGFFFSNDPVEASSYATFDWGNDDPRPNVIPVYLALKNPLVVTLQNEQSPYDNPAIWYDHEGREAVERAQELGHDSLVVVDERDDFLLDNGQKPTLYVAFKPEQIKSAIGNNGDFDAENSDIRFSVQKFSADLVADRLDGARKPHDVLSYRPALFSFAGPKALTANDRSLDSAQQLLKNGGDPESIRKETGWFVGVDGRFRFEIKDSDAKLRSPKDWYSEVRILERALYAAQHDFEKANRTKVDALKAARKALHIAQSNLNQRTLKGDLLVRDVLEHPELLGAYPSIGEIRVKFDPNMAVGSASYEEIGPQGKPEITIGRSKSPEPDVLLSTLLHEIQHCIQFREGFAVGGYPGFSNADLPNEAIEGIEFLKAEANFASISGDPDKASQLRGEAEKLRLAAGYDRYRRLAGEVEARNTQARQRMTDAERRATSPSETADVSENHVVVVMNGLEMMGVPMPANALARHSVQRPRTPASSVRACLSKAYGNLLSRLEDNGLVSLTQTEEEAISDAAQARVAKIGGDLDAIKTSLRKSVLAQRVWHGTPHRGIRTFSTDKIGTGEGAQAFGWGLYFGDRREIAEHYRLALSSVGYDTPSGRALTRKSLADEYGFSSRASDFLISALDGSDGDVSQAIKDLSGERALDGRVGSTRYRELDQVIWFLVNFEGLHLKQSKGQLYEVEIPEDSDMLLWDKPLSEQPAKIKDVILYDMGLTGKWQNGTGGERRFIMPPDASMSGGAAYARIARLLGSEQRASEALLAAGIKGIKYLDGQSRTYGQGSYNYVIFDGADTQIVDVKYSQDGHLEGFFDPEIGRAYLISDGLTEQSAPGTLMHEVGIHMAADGKLQPMFDRAAKLIRLGRNNPFLRRVQARLDAAGETSAEEAAAYLVTEYENSRLSAPPSVVLWVQDFIADIRAWLFSKGVLLKADQLTIADVVAVARANARGMAKGDGNGDVKYSKAAPTDQTQTAAFKRWFGDSKVVDADGKPLVVYHGTSADFDTFDKKKAGAVWNADREGFFFSSDPATASEYADFAVNQTRGAASVMPVYVSVKNPLTFEKFAALTNGIGLSKRHGDGVDSLTRFFDDERNLLVRYAKQEKHDGILLERDGVQLVVAFSPTQIKSAIGNNGNFDPANPDIRRSVRGGGNNPAFVQRGLGKEDNGVIRLQRAQVGGATLRPAAGEAGYGIYAYFPKSSSMRRYYSGKGWGEAPSLWDIDLDASRLVDLTKPQHMAPLLEYAREQFARLERSMPGYIKPVVGAHNIQRFGRIIEKFVRECRPWAGAWVVGHQGPGVPTSKQVVISDASAVLSAVPRPVLPASADTVQAALSAPASPVEPLPDLEIDLNAQLLKVAKSNEGRVVNAAELNEALLTLKDSLYEEVFSVSGVGPFDGGCLAMARAIEPFLPGSEVVALVDDAGIAQHAAVRFRHWLFDANGGMPERLFCADFARSNHLGCLHVRSMQDGDLPEAIVDDALQARLRALIDREVSGDTGKEPRPFAGVVFHVTPTRNLLSMLDKGIEARIGPRSEAAGETVACSYHFVSAEAMDDALLGWLTDCFDEAEALCAVAVDVEGLTIAPGATGFEIQVKDRIEPSRLCLVHRQIDSLTSTRLMDLSAHAAMSLVALRRAPEASQQRQNEAEMLGVAVPDIAMSFAGESARTADVQRLRHAQWQQALGHDERAIWTTQGWVRGADDKWRFEIDDSHAGVNMDMLRNIAQGPVCSGMPEVVALTYKVDDVAGVQRFDVTLVPPNPQKLSDLASFIRMDATMTRNVLGADLFARMQAGEGDEDLIGNFEPARRFSTPGYVFEGFNALPLNFVLNHPGLFDAYPQLADVMVTVDSSVDGVAAYVTAGQNGEPKAIVLRSIAIGRQQLLSAVLHEVQHAIQEIEGFARGGSIDSAARHERSIRYLMTEQALARLYALKDRFPGTYKAYNDMQAHFFGCLSAHGIDAFGQDGSLLDLMTLTRHLTKVESVEQARKRHELVDAYRQWMEREVGEFGSPGQQLWGQAVSALSAARMAAPEPASEVYRRLAGEVEARNVQFRIKFDAARRSALMPQETADVDAAGQVFMAG